MAKAKDKVVVELNVNSAPPAMTVAASFCQKHKPRCAPLIIPPSWRVTPGRTPTAIRETESTPGPAQARHLPEVFAIERQ